MRKFLLISNVSSDTVELVKADTHEVEAYMGVPRSPQRFAVFPQKELLFAIGRFDNVVAILDLQDTKEVGRLLGTMPVGRGACDLGPLCGFNLHPRAKSVKRAAMGDNFFQSHAQAKKAMKDNLFTEVYLSTAVTTPIQVKG